MQQVQYRCLESIEYNVTSIKNYFKDMSHYTRNKFLLVEERLKIYKRETQKQEHLIKLETDIKRKELKLLDLKLNAAS